MKKKLSETDVIFNNQPEIVERSSGWWLVDNMGVVNPKPYTSYGRAKQGFNAYVRKRVN